MSFHETIRQAQAQLNALRNEVIASARLRDRSALHSRQWKEACRRYQKFDSPLHGLMQRCRDEDIANNPTLREFAIDFLECDPMFSGSGYFKERLLTSLKSVPVVRVERDRLNSVLISAVQQRGRREFKYYCRLAAAIYNEELIRELEPLMRVTDPAISARARRMDACIRQSITSRR